MEYFLVVIIGVASSLCASALFLLILTQLRPKISISDCIAKSVIDGKPVYIFKTINKTYCKLYDLHAQVIHINFENVTGGQNIFSQPLTLLKDNIWSVNRIKSIEKDINAEFAILFVCSDDLEAIWKDPSMIEFRIMAKHSFSGFSEIAKKRYHRCASSVKQGSFKFGNSFEID